MSNQTEKVNGSTKRIRVPRVEHEQSKDYPISIEYKADVRKIKNGYVVSGARYTLWVYAFSDVEAIGTLVEFCERESYVIFPYSFEMMRNGTDI